MQLIRPVASTLAALALVSAGQSFAQTDYPNRSVQIVVSVPAGGSIDMVARNVAEHLGRTMDQAFIVNNRPGASGIIGTDFVARADPDGYTLNMAPAAFIASNVSMFKNLPYDPLEDFAPVSLVVDQPMALVVSNDSPYQSVAELVAYAKENPGQLAYGSGGEGSPHHFSGLLFGVRADIDMLHVPYKGGAPAMNDLLGGHVDFVFSPMPEALPHVQGGKLKALAITAPERSEVLPDVPTMAEEGVPVELTAWVGLVAPAGTSPEIIEALNAEIERGLQGEMGDAFREMGLTVAGGSPERFGEVIRNDIALYAELADAAGIEPQ